MRLMDGADGVFAFPFELLLGAKTQIGIHHKPNLVAGKYRWNVFRDNQEIQAKLEQKQTKDISLDACESELKEWLEARKFNVLSKHRIQAQGLINRFAFQKPSKSQLLHTEDVLTYINEMKSIFTESDSEIKLIHAPCAALDWNSQPFWRIFNKVIIIVIDPKWGFGNMNARNQISAYRYLERWNEVNQESLWLKKQHPGKVLILRTSINADQQEENLKQCHCFLDIHNVNPATQHPTLLGEAMGEVGFPYGGILNWNLQAYQHSLNLAHTKLANADNQTLELLARCVSLYKLLQT